LKPRHIDYETGVLTISLQRCFKNAVTRYSCMDGKEESQLDATITVYW